MSGSDEGKVFNVDLIMADEVSTLTIKADLKELYPEAERIDVTEV